MFERSLCFLILLEGNLFRREVKSFVRVATHADETCADRVELRVCPSTLRFPATEATLSTSICPWSFEGLCLSVQSAALGSAQCLLGIWKRNDERASSCGCVACPNIILTIGATLTLFLHSTTYPPSIYLSLRVPHLVCNTEPALLVAHRRLLVHYFLLSSM